MPDSIVIEILTKKDCTLCDEVKKIVNKVIVNYSTQLIMTDIEMEPSLFEDFKERIPLVRINGEESFVFKVNEKNLRQKLDTINKLKWACQKLKIDFHKITVVKQTLNFVSLKKP